MALDDNKFREYIDELLKKEVRVDVDKDGVVYLQKHPFDESIPLGELRKIARSWAKNRYKVPNPKKPGSTIPTTQKNLDKRHDIEISPGGIGHTVRDAEDVFTLYSLSALPQMIEHMKCVGIEPPSEEWKKKEPRALRAERYEAKVKISENAFTAHFLVRVSKKGLKETAQMAKFGYYNHYVK